MYSDDRRYHVRSMNGLKVTLEETDRSVRALMRELADDDFDGTQDSRARLAEARGALEEAAGSLERAVEQLPEGKQRKPLPRI